MGPHTFINSIVKILRSKGVPLEGCSEEEIFVMETQASNRLPKAYVEFLEMMGKSAGCYMEDCDCFYPEILNGKENAMDLLDDNGFHQELPKDAFVFWERQGYQFAFFVLDGTEDPLVYYYLEGQKTDFVQNETFIEFLQTELKHARLA